MNQMRQVIKSEEQIRKVSVNTIKKLLEKRECKPRRNMCQLL